MTDAQDHPTGAHVEPEAADDILELFTEPTREWFRAAFGAPTAAQAGAWRAVSERKNALVVAPTGSGKTLSAFLWSLDQLFAAPAEGTTVLYISPLKALGVDIERNLRSPLVGIGHTARRLGQEPSEISVGVRSGDTTAKARRDLVRNPPNVLITTPESLYLMLTSQARSTLTGISTVIVDEVHALAGTKRGAHLALSLERLDALLEAPAQRIGLSATVEPRDEVARFLSGRAPAEVVAPPAQKQWDITVSVPVPDLGRPEGLDEGGTDDAAPMQPSIWPHVEHRIVDLVAQRRSTIVFVNSRRLAERLTGRLNEIWAERQAVTGGGQDDGQAVSQDDEASALLARSHHGSVSKEQREVIEEDLKAGRLRCVVATSSLELGIDMGAVDLVVQVESPPAVSAGLQRVGRAGHQVGEVSVGWFFPKHRGDLVSTAVVVERMLDGRIEALHVPRNPLDVLAQQTVAAAALEPLDVEDWFETVRRSAPFSSLPRSAFEAVLDLLAGRYPSDRFAELRPRIVWDREAGTLTGRPGAQRLAVTSGGTIPDRGLFGVYLAGGEESGSARTGGRRVGELDEEMVYESRVGDVFALGATSWRIEEITFDRVLVTPAFDQPAAMPFWRGDGLGRPAELGRALGEFQRQVLAEGESPQSSRLDGIGLDQWARENLRRYLREQSEAVGALPSDTTLVVERTRDELGDWRIILHSPYGLQVHSPWALAVGERLHERYGLDGSAMASDDGIVLRVPMMDEEPPGAELFRFEADELEELVTAQVSSSPLFAGRFREAAARALLLPRTHPGQRTPLWQQRQRSSQLLEVAAGYPDFPMIMEAMREVLQDVYDMPALLDLMRRIAGREVRMVESTTHTPSPFAQSVLFGYIAQYLYEGDSPLAERRAAALSVDPQMLGELLGRVELRDVLDAEIIAEAEAYAQRLLPARRLRGDEVNGPESVADLLRLLGPLSAAELARRLRPEEEAERREDERPEPSGPAPKSEDSVLSAWQAQRHAEALVTAQRAFRIGAGADTRYAAIEDAARLRDGLGTPMPPGIPQVFLEPVEDPLGDLLSRYARTHGPFLTAEAAEALGLSTAVVEEVLHRLAGESRVVAGLFRPERAEHRSASGAQVEEWCEVEMLRRIRRRSLAALRADVEPVSPAAFAAFLPVWQSASPHTHTDGREGLVEALTQLSGVAAPASAWESLILPARVRDYRPALLDELITSGEVVVAGRGALSGHDGWVSFHPREDAEAGLLPAQDPQAERFVPDARQQALCEVLDGGGAWFAEALQARLEASRSEVEDSLWELFWAGQVHPDSFAPVRHRLAGGATAHRTRSRPARSRHAARRTALRRAVQERRGEQAAPGARWARITPDPPPDPQEPSAAQAARSYARAEILLDRYGVLTRGSVAAEQQAGGFAAVYRVLSAAEQAGRVRRGYVVERLGAAQFALSATIDRIRQVSEALEDGRGADVVVLAATDPANAYGAALDWPELEGVSHRPGRKAGAVVVLRGGELIVYMERGGRTMLVYTEDEEVLTEVAQPLVDTLRQAHTGRLAVEKISGISALKHPFGDALRAAGFHTSPSGLRFSG